MARTVCTISLLFTSLFLACRTSESDRSNAQVVSSEGADASGRVELVRDQWGVPHIFARTDAGAMYGLGYATAQDRAFQMYYNLRIIQGRLAETVGDVKVGVTRQLPQGRNSALRSDIKMRTIGYYRAARETARRLDPELRELMEAYCRGVNDYISGHPDDLPDLFGKYGLHRVVVEIGSVLLRRRPQRIAGLLRDQGRPQAGAALRAD
jgi:acyl-homoserine lactone acylase PvdQ